MSEFVSETLGTWDCIDPCALIIQMLDDNKLSDDIKGTLDCFGWLDEYGRPDLEKAAKEINRVRKLETQNV